MQKLLVKARIKALSTYKGKSKFPFWHNIAFGDVITITIDLAHEESEYATGVFLVNETNNQKTFLNSTINLQNYLKKIEWQQIDNA